MTRRPSALRSRAAYSARALMCRSRRRSCAARARTTGWRRGCGRCSACAALRAGDTFMVTLWPVGTDAAALPAVLGPGAELMAQRGGEEAQQGRTRQRLARRLGIWRAAHGADAVAAAGARAACAGGGGALRHAGAALWRGTWRVLRGGSLGPDVPGLLAALILFAYSAYADLHGPAAVLSRAVRHRLRAAGGEVRGAAGARRASRTGAAAAASAPAHGDCRAGRRGDAGGRRRAHAAQRGARSAGRACPGRRRRALRHLHSRCIRPHGRSPAGGKGGGGTQFWPARSTARAAHSSRPRRLATRRRCSGRSQPCSARRPCAHRSRCGSSGRHHASPRCSSFWRSALAPYGFFWRQPGDLARALTCTCAVLAATCPGAAGQAAGVACAGRDRPSGRAGRAAHVRRGGVGRADGAHRAPVGIWLLLAYHAVCLPLAACGVIGPGAAAVLACGASGGVLLCALRGNETKGERP